MNNCEKINKTYFINKILEWAQCVGCHGGLEVKERNFSMGNGNARS